jgi:hypothetical protein
VIPRNVALFESSETAYDTCRKSEESRSNAEMLQSASAMDWQPDSPPRSLT